MAGAPQPALSFERPLHGWLHRALEKVAGNLAGHEAEVDVRLGDYTFQNVPAGLHHNSICPGESGLLGAGLLARFNTLTLDAQAGRLILGDPAGAALPFHVETGASSSRPSLRR